MGNYQEALKSFDYAIALKTDYALYWTNRGNALRKLGQIENALASYKTALSIDPTDSNAHNWQTILLEDLERRSKENLHIRPSSFKQVIQETERSAFHQALLSSGLVKQIKQPFRSTQPKRQLIRVKGKPISELIIEERR